MLRCSFPRSRSNPSLSPQRADACFFFFPTDTRKPSDLTCILNEWLHTVPPLLAVGPLPLLIVQERPQFDLSSACFSQGILWCNYIHVTDVLLCFCGCLSPDSMPRPSHIVPVIKEQDLLSILLVTPSFTTRPDPPSARDDAVLLSTDSRRRVVVE